jgi:hypothetical protein
MILHRRKIRSQISIESVMNGILERMGITEQELLDANDR